MKKMAATALVICLSSTLHAQECIAPVGQYVGILFDDGRCLPWSKRNEKLLSDNTPRCTPNLKGHLESPLIPKMVNGAFVDTRNACPMSCGIALSVQTRLHSKNCSGA